MIYLQSISANIHLSINPKITIVQMQKRGLGAEDWGLGSCPQGSGVSNTTFPYRHLFNKILLNIYIL